MNLGLCIDTEKMALSLIQEKLQMVLQQCQEIFCQSKASILTLTKLVRFFSSTVQAVLPARIQFCYFQQEQILVHKKHRTYRSHLTLKIQQKVNFGGRWKKKLCNGRKIPQHEPHMIIQSDASTKDSGHTAKNFQQRKIVSGRKQNSYKHC